jgi:hypothetical protein
MASRIIHLAITSELIKEYHFKNEVRLKFGAILPDAYAAGRSTVDSHLKIGICGNNKRTYDFTRFRGLFSELMKEDDLYLGYYLHLVQDILFRHFVYDEHHWNATIPGNVDRLHRDYAIVNSYVICKYGLKDDIEVPLDFEKEPINSICHLEPHQFVSEMKDDFEPFEPCEIFFFSKDMADQFISKAVSFCLEELRALEKGTTRIDEYEYAWKNTPRVLLKTTLNTRELGGYRVKGEKNYTNYNVLIRSDIQKHPSEDDLEFLRKRNITTIIDMRGRMDAEKAPSGFLSAEGFKYYNIQIDEGSGVPESVEAVPNSYLDIAAAKNMVNVFKTIASSHAGVMFNCTAGKDRTGVVSALILLLCGVSDEDIIFDYMLTKECNKVRFELVHKNFPDIDMNIVIPNEKNMRKFLNLIIQYYGDVQGYFTSIGVTDAEQKAIRDKLIG